MGKLGGEGSSNQTEWGAWTVIVRGKIPASSLFGGRGGRSVMWQRFEAARHTAPAIKKQGACFARFLLFSLAVRIDLPTSVILI